MAVKSKLGIIGIAAVAVLALLAVAFLITSSPAAAQSNSPPATPASVNLTRTEGIVTATYPKPAGTAKFHVTYSTDGGHTWHSAASPSDNHTSTRKTITDADDTKPYIVGVRAGNAHGWSGWRNSPAIAPLPPPATPASVTVTRADGTLTATWPAPDGAARYHITYSSDNGQSWSAAAVPSDDYFASSITINNVVNTKPYIVAVRAGNSNGWSGWRNSPIAPAYKPPTGTMPPDAPTSVTLTRADGTVTATWPAVDAATSYHVGFSDDNGRTWNRGATFLTETSVTLSADNSKTYIVCVMSVNDNGGSEWRNSAPAGPYTP